MTSIKARPFLPCFLAALAILGSSPAAHAAVTVVNGDFQDTTGLSSLGGGWYAGVPAGWTGQNANYTVGTPATGNTVANLEAVSNTSGGFTPLSQTIGTLDATSTVTLTFTVLQPWNANAARVGVAIWTDPALVNVLVTQSDYAPGTYSLTAENVPAGTNLTIGFWRSRSSNSPGLDNVSVTVTPVPEASAAVLLSLLVPVAASARRRRACH